MKHDLEKGYDNTGYIPDEFDDLSKIPEMEKREKEYAMMCCDEQDVGGFLKRKNKHERM